MSSCVVHGSTSCGWDKGKLPTDDDSGHGTDRQQDAAADGPTPDGSVRNVAPLLQGGAQMGLAHLGWLHPCGQALAEAGAFGVAGWIRPAQ
ncbi:hypothetical protein RQL69_09920 [Citrobacter freundii]|nr:hypothetical protein [Citrobacter freundii]MDT7209630.1 hypothetical protein [Citrobacter freundii]MDX7261942.1 hypothetical protein [Citrobacter freundii]